MYKVPQFMVFPTFFYISSPYRTR